MCSTAHIDAPGATARIQVSSAGDLAAHLSVPIAWADDCPPCPPESCLCVVDVPAMARAADMVAIRSWDVPDDGPDLSPGDWLIAFGPDPDLIALAEETHQMSAAPPAPTPDWFTLDIALQASRVLIAEHITTIEEGNSQLDADLQPIAGTMADDDASYLADWQGAAEAVRGAEGMVNTVLWLSSEVQAARGEAAALRAEIEAIRLRSAKRSERQGQVGDWIIRAFGPETMTRLDERAARVIEEAIELGQAVGVTPETVAKIAGYVYARPVGELGQEIGGIGVTLLGFAEAAGLNADVEEAREVARVLAKPVEHWTRRQAEKRAAGLTPGITANDDAPAAVAAP